ncbi:MAG: transketolase [Ignavibacteria bacterium RBG_13_36_8]|nr:MAG: transketolase [Ignavibacteria bacterium RBG_13_36_8]
MNSDTIHILQKVAHNVRALSADAIEKQQSGHPGLPLGAAEIGTYLYLNVMKHNPKNPKWMGRDRFILSAGHGSMLQYALLHLCGYDISLEDLKDFRILHSKTPGHPEYGVTPGVETTTGPLGQGIAAGTGMAIAQKFLAARFGNDLFDSKIYILAGDGCMMEGIGSEAGSLAGTLGLNNLVIIYDSNDICLDGPTEDCFTEDIAKRYEAYGFNVFQIDGYNFFEMESAFKAAQSEKQKPTLIIAKTIIGRFSPTRAGSNESHGKFLGPEMKGFKNAIGWPDDPFHIPDEVKTYMESLIPKFEKYEKQWDEKFEKMKSNDSSKADLWNTFMNKTLPQDFEEQLWNLNIEPNQPTRKYNEILIAKAAEMLPFLISGSADVASVDFTWLPGNKIVKRNDWNHQQIKFGVREFSMAAAAYGMILHGMIQPVIGTFLVFSDYMRNAVRMSAMMKQRVIYIYTHDSILIGQDGPTHQPIEHLMSLRLIPNLTVIRPGDENETKAAWAVSLLVDNGPVAICFSRQPVESAVNKYTLENSKEGLKRGAYLLYGDKDESVDIEIFASGSEINTSFQAAKLLEEEGLTVRLISVPSWELFDKQEEEYKEMILNGEAKLKVSVEAGVGLGWQKFVGNDGLIISQETYGESAPEAVMADHFGFTGEKIYNKVYKRVFEKIKMHT